MVTVIAAPVSSVVQYCINTGHAMSELVWERNSRLLTTQDSLNCRTWKISIQNHILVPLFS
jgi:hypothetical protein